ncbi:hypothetical protein EJ08DRAFT_606817 [Tothia fuscella]|uniref:Cytochrome c oxidase assembly factor 6 n=1 Tax=Tothia fuscella TaxID=1048955 RepID=A0A9P4U269_9PEZI|nr:hypothetical protein EJ08DRAFT_606817 [Tothia fuscella]
MGILPNWSASSGDAQNPKVKGAKPTGDGAYEAPGRLSRAQCWDARDGYNQCLDRNNILDAIKDKDTAEKACGQESQNFEKNCASSWVTYFKQRRVAEYEKEQLLKKQEAASLASR